MWRVCNYCNKCKLDQFGTEVCLEKDRKINHAKSKPCGDMAASIFDWLIDKELNFQIYGIRNIVMQI